MRLGYLAIAIAGQAFAAPLFAELVISGPNDAGQVLFPSATADGGVTRLIELHINSNAQSTLDALSVIDDAGVFAVEAITPQRLSTSPNSTPITLHFKPFNQLGTFSGRLVIDWNDYRRDDSIVLCGVAESTVDGGVAAPCAAPPRAASRPLPPEQPARGCSASPVGLAIFALLAWLRIRRSSDVTSRSPARAGSDRSPR